MVRRSYISGKNEKCNKKQVKNQTESEKKLLVLEFFTGQKDPRTSNWIFDHQPKFNKIAPDTGTALLDAMYDEKLLERTAIPDGTDKPKIVYNISPDGRKAIETIKKLKDENHPMVKLDFFRLLD